MIDSEWFGETVAVWKGLENFESPCCLVELSCEAYRKASRSGGTIVIRKVWKAGPEEGGENKFFLGREIDMMNRLDNCRCRMGVTEKSVLIIRYYCSELVERGY